MAKIGKPEESVSTASNHQSKGEQGEDAEAARALVHPLEQPVAGATIGERGHEPDGWDILAYQVFKGKR